MPLPKRQTISNKLTKVDKSQEDTRFANFTTDPKFRLPSKKYSKAKLDPRFARIRSDPDFHHKATVDKYGRKISKESGKKAIERLYTVDDEDPVDDDDKDIARPTERKRDKDVLKELQRVEKQGYDPIRDGGLDSSTDESSSDEEEELDVDEQTELAGDDHVVPTGDISSRLALVNMDWDNVKAADIMAVALSFIPADGRVLSVVIYPSDFGLERMQREEIEGPPREIFASTSDMTENGGLDSLQGSTKVNQQGQLNDNDGEEFNSNALRTYQLDRLRYYYAIITCSSANAAKSIYDNLDGQEYMTSANFFDLRFVPDGTTFDQETHDECSKIPDGHTPNEFTTDALTHSKVKLTWDADDSTRIDVQKRAFSRKEIDDNELQAYLGNDLSSSQDEAETTKADKAASLRQALGLDDSRESKKAHERNKSTTKKDRNSSTPANEMQVTFSGGLLNSNDKGSVFENEIPINETSAERYVRKERERRTRRKERAQARRNGQDPDAVATEPAQVSAKDEAQDPFDDPFFASDPEENVKAFKQEKKSRKAQKRAEKDEQDQAAAAERANLELLMADDGDSKMRHFDMKEIVRAEKARKKGKKGGKNVTMVEDSFQINPVDPRFAKLYESHEFAIDPTNPRFKDTAGMKALLEEGRKKRKQDGREDEGEDDAPSELKKQKQEIGNESASAKLAAKIKAKSKYKTV